MSERPSFISEQVSKSAYYFFDLNPKPAASVKVVCGGWESCLPEYRIDRATFPYFSLEFVSAGKGMLTLGGRRFKLVPGTVFHYGPGIAHYIATDPDSLLEKYFVDFVGATAADVLAQVPFSKLQPLYLAGSAPVARVFEELQTRGTSRSMRTERLCSVLAELLLLLVADTAVPLGHERSAAWASFDRCRRYVEEHHVTLRRLDEVSEACHLDKPYICRLFKRFGRETPYRMIMRLKMDHAADLLLHSNLLIKEAAMQVGFDDPYHFSHVFKRVRGLAPADFIRLSRHRLEP